MKHASVVPVTDETTPAGRAKTIGPRASSGVCHADNDAAVGADGQHNHAADSFAVRLRSKVKAEARVTGTALIRWALNEMSVRDIAALIDASGSKEVHEMLSGGNIPWKAESFVLTAERAPEFAVRIIVAYAHLMASRRGPEWIDRTINALVDLRDGRVEVPSC